MMQTPHARLAPSPTGAQHLGNARTYLIAWLAARSAGARITLRIEDIDSPRVKLWATALIEEDLRWLGLDWDEGPFFQTRRLPLYEAALECLRRAELVYPCTCTRSDIAGAASAPHLDGDGPAYPGTCAGRTAADAAKIERPYAWRFRFRQAPAFEDRVRGRVAMSAEQAGGDFVVWKSSQTPAYQLAVVVDDAAMAITEVVRGDDLLSSTPRQLALFDALGWTPPRYAHVPLVIGADGRRLAKRHGDTRIATLRENGFRPEQITGLLAWSCGWLPEIRPIRASELIPRFNWNQIPPMPLVYADEILQKIVPPV